MKLLLRLEMPEEEIEAFTEQEIQVLLDKKLTTKARLTLATVDDLKEPPGLLTASAKAIVAAFNPSSLAPPGTTPFQTS